MLHTRMNMFPPASGAGNINHKSAEGEAHVKTLCRLSLRAPDEPGLGAREDQGDIPRRRWPHSAAMQQIRKQFAKLNQWTERKPAGDAKVYRVQAEKGPCIVKITLDKQGKIARVADHSRWRAWGRDVNSATTGGEGLLSGGPRSNSDRPDTFSRPARQRPG